MGSLFAPLVGFARDLAGRWSTYLSGIVALSLLPRMNERGKDYKYTLVYPDGTSKVLLSVPKFSDSWQPSYIFKTPIAAPKGSRIETIAHYDNSAANKQNPDPTARVTFGPEIMNGYFDYTADHQNLLKETTRAAAPR